MPQFVKTLLLQIGAVFSKKLRDKLTYEREKEATIRRLQGRRIQVIALFLILSVLCCSGCSLRDLYIDTVNSITNTTAPEADEATIEELYVEERAAAQEIVNKSERLHNLVIPATAPSVKLISYDLNGSIVFESETLGSGSISGEPNHREWFILTEDSETGDVGDAAASHGTKDSRWNKYWGENTKRFVIVLTREKRSAIEEWSLVTIVEKTES